MDVSYNAGRVGITPALSAAFMLGQGFWPFIGGRKAAYDFFGLELLKGEKPSIFVVSKAGRDIAVGILVIACCLAGQTDGARLACIACWPAALIDAWCVYHYGGPEFHGFSGKFWNHTLGGTIGAVLAISNIGF